LSFFDALVKGLVPEARAIGVLGAMVRRLGCFV